MSLCLCNDLNQNSALSALEHCCYSQLCISKQIFPIANVINHYLLLILCGDV